MAFFLDRRPGPLKFDRLEYGVILVERKGRLLESRKFEASIALGLSKTIEQICEH